MNGDGFPTSMSATIFKRPIESGSMTAKVIFVPCQTGAIRHTSHFSMGVDFADIDRDGYDDIFVADMLAREHVRRQIQVMNETAFTQARQATRDRPQLSRNTLFRNRGNGTYAEIGQVAGLDASDWSWSPAFIDVDLDGYEDLLITTGHLRDLQNIDVAQAIEAEKQNRPMSWLEKMRLRGRFPKLDTPNAAFRNRGDLTFKDVSSTWHFDSRAISHGMALADLDNDGDLDVIVNCLGDAPLLYRNDASAPRIAVKLHGKQSNSYGVGARITVTTVGLPQQSAELKCGGRYLSTKRLPKNVCRWG